jgi:hypothetical protein
MRYAILLGLCALTLLESQTIDPNKTGFPHDMIWFNEPKNPQPGVTHHGYHSVSMNKEVGYNIWLPPGYETSSRQYPVVYWLHRTPLASPAPLPLLPRLCPLRAGRQFAKQRHARKGYSLAQLEFTIQRITYTR